jgi:precorrin-6A synthase
MSLPLPLSCCSLSGDLADIGPQVIATRAAARATHGWIIGIYMLQRHLKIT